MSIRLWDVVFCVSNARTESGVNLFFGRIEERMVDDVEVNRVAPIVYTVGTTEMKN